MFTAAQLTDDFRKIGIEAGDILTVHSSMKKIGDQVDGGPQAVIQALLDALGEDGTLIMPVFTSPKEFIDLNEESSRLGLITETFRIWPEVLRSNDATHSVAAIGKHAEEILAGHEDVAPLDENSPLHKAALMGGKVLHLGTDLKSCSLVHVAESILDIPYQHIPYPGYENEIRYKGTDGVERVQTRTKSPGDSNGFLVLMERPGVQKICKTGLIGHATSYLFDAKILLDETIALLKEDPAGLLCWKDFCKICGPRREALAQQN